MRYGPISAMTTRATMTTRPTTAVLLRRKRRMISRRRVRRLDCPAPDVGSSVGPSVATSSRFSAIGDLLAQPHTRVEDGDRDVGQDRADQHAGAAEGDDRDRAVDVLLG